MKLGITDIFPKSRLLQISVVILAFGLAACVNEAGTVSDVHTGVSGSHSRVYPAASGLLYNLNAGALVGKQGSETRYAIGTQYSATGLGWAFFEEAWSFGQQLPFEVQGRDTAGCGGGSCTIVERGLIRLTKQQFKQAAKTGIEFKLIGKQRDIVARVPAQAFAEALARAPS